MGGIIETYTITQVEIRQRFSSMSLERLVLGDQTKLISARFRTDKKRSVNTQHIVSMWNSSRQDVEMATGLDDFKKY